MPEPLSFAPGPVEDRVRQRHPPPALVDARHGHVGIGNLQYRVAGDKRGGVPVGAEAEVDQIEHRRGAG